MMIRATASFVLVQLCLCFATAANGTEKKREPLAGSFAELPNYINLGDTVFLAGQSGQVIKARVQELAPTEIHLIHEGTPLVMSKDDVRRIEVQYHDSLLNGALIGAAVGSALTAVTIVGNEVVVASAEAAAIVAVYVGGGAAIGVGMDALFKKRRLVYSGPADDSGTRFSMYPIVARDRKGVAVSVSF